MKGSLLSCSAVLLLLLPWFGGLAVGKISKDFSECLYYFYKNIPPRGIIGANYQPICQEYNNIYRFATLYHKWYKTPLFSAYILSKADGPRPRVNWMYEPQLVNPYFPPDMRPFPEPVPKDVIESQAVDNDYKLSKLTRGHLNPSMHQMGEEDRIATFTLTNIVPQEKGSNSGLWNDWEKKVLQRKNYCIGPMYVITGVIPYMSPSHWINNRVAVPEYIWSAYCCPEYSKPLPDHLEMFFPTYGAVGRNYRNSGGEIVPTAKTGENKGYEVSEMPLETLEGILSNRLNQNRTVNLFDSKCLNAKKPIEN
ncbi:PREDICTED: endonuclease domain-containing 1 protein-like [Cyprinodon variegatus]|nr:PREDICTED: endonuclease domain-containing 1 protein-like [Cyprinodon variegatus]